MARHFISRKEAAAMMGLSGGTLSNWHSRRFGPRVYNPTGGKALYDRQEVENFILGITPETPRPRRGRPPRVARSLAPS